MWVAHNLGWVNHSLDTAILLAGIHLVEGGGCLSFPAWQPSHLALSWLSQRILVVGSKPTKGCQCRALVSCQLSQVLLFLTRFKPT